MQTEIKEAGPCKLSVKIEISKETIKEKLADKYKDFIGSTVIPGFRKGNAPKELVERKFGKAIKDDTKMEIINESYTKLLEEKKLSPVVEPVIEAEKLTLDENKPLVVEFTMETKPEVDLKKDQYTGISVKKEKVEVKDKDVKDALEKLQQSAREYIPLDKGQKIEEKDMVIIDQEMKVEDKSIEKRDNVELIVGQEIRVFNKKMNEFIDALKAMKKGDTKEVKLTVPEDFSKKELAGKPAVLTVTIKEHKKENLPEINDAWAKKMNFDSLDSLKKELENRIKEEKERRVELKAEEDIIDAILKKTKFDLPESLIEKGADHIQKRKKMMLHYQGKNEKEITEELDKEKGTAREAVIKDLKSHYILEHIAKQEKVFVTEDEVSERINQIAAQSRRWPNEVRAQYEKDNSLAQLRGELRETKVRKFLREKAKITD